MKKDSKNGDLKRMMRMKSLQELKEEMMDEMGEDFAPHMEGMKKVTVASDDDEGLEEGLDKAKEILKKRKGMKKDDCDMDDKE